MIPLRVSSRSSSPMPFVARLNSEARAFRLDQAGKRTPFDADLVEVAPGQVVYQGPQGEIRLRGVSPDEVDGDVLLVPPGDRSSQRLVRATSDHNTFLVTERCDQLCVMCSQPPKAHHVDLFPYFEAAALLAPFGMTLGISGGEPTLFKAALFGLMSRVLAERSDLRFHVLSNGQHLGEEDCEWLAALPRNQLLWGVPLYAADAELHDRLVGKAGAFERLMSTFALLARSGASIELRTVVTAANAEGLPRLAQFVAAHLPFVSSWALMQLENIGFGRQHWGELFFDNSLSFRCIGEALNIARARGIEAVLYNFPRCTVPPSYRHLAPATISDWKRRFLAECIECPEQTDCGGFFEWYPQNAGFKRLGLT